MPNETYKVIVVLDSEYGSRLFDLVPNVPIWIVGSPCNRAATEKRWKEIPNASHLTGVTVIRESPELSPEVKLIANLGTIDLHHGEYSADPPYTVLEIVGVSFSDKLVKELSAFGFDEFERSSEGFIAKRPLPSA